MELPEDQMPPDRYWHSQDHLSEWFHSVKQRMKDRSKGIESIDPGGEQDTDEGFFTDPDVAGLRG